MKTEAYLNHGRWLANCPRCGTPNQIGPEDEELICLRCYPEQRASIPDMDRRLKAIARAKKNRDVHKVVFRQAPGEVLKLTRKRRRENANWRPGETLADLKRENKEHGVK